MLPEKKNYETMTDEELVQQAHSNDDGAKDFLMHKYKNLVRLKSRTYFLIGADKEDIIQEGMIGLFKAIRDYQLEKQTPFYNFAEVCITRQIITAIKTATRQKHIPLNSSISLNTPVFDEENDQTYFDFMPADSISNPEDILIAQEQKNIIEANMSKILSRFECKVLILYLTGNTYYRIAELMEKDEKSIDNALQRIKRKLSKFLSEKDIEK